MILIKDKIKIVLDKEDLSGNKEFLSVAKNICLLLKIREEEFLLQIDNFNGYSLFRQISFTKVKFVPKVLYNMHLGMLLSKLLYLALAWI